MPTPLINPSHIAAATSSGVSGATAGARGAEARKANAAAYAAAMREANAPETAQRQTPQREVPFGVERPRYQRPGALLDIKV